MYAFLPDARSRPDLCMTGTLRIFIEKRYRVPTLTHIVQWSGLPQNAESFQKKRRKGNDDIIA